MEEKYSGEQHQQARRDYDGYKKTTYTSEGRRIRPRRKVSTSDNQDSSEQRTYSNRNHFSSEKRNNSQYGRSYGHHNNSYGGNRKSYSHDNNDSRGPVNRGYSSDNRREYNNNYNRNYSDRRDSSSYKGDRNSDNSSYQDRPQRRSFYQSNDRNRNSYNNNRPSYNNGPRNQNRYAKRTPNRYANKEDSGINNMINNQTQISPEYIINTPTKEVERLNKFIANSGICSRREADTFIQAGVVTVNGEVVTELGTKVNVLNDDVRFNGQRIKGEPKVYIVMNKPRGYVTTSSDPHADKTVMDLLKGCKSRVFPVGRLDKNTTGVLMFTNDGEIAEKLTHPSFNKKKIYQVILDKALEVEDKEKILAGIELNDGVIKADELEYIDAEDHKRLGIEIHSGKNRIVRRIFESLGYTVKALDRVYFAGLTKKGLKKGEWRYLSANEVNILKMGAYV